MAIFQKYEKFHKAIIEKSKNCNKVSLERLEKTGKTCKRLEILEKIQTILVLMINMYNGFMFYDMKQREVSQ